VKEIRYADSGGVSIAWTAVGDGPRDLVLIPGFVSHLEVLWEHELSQRFLRRLASFARVILYDKREQGLSDRVGRPPTLEESMDDLQAVLDAAGSERASIVGVSEGGPMAVMFAATHPERVARLVVIGSYAKIVNGPDFDAGTPREALEHFFAVLRSDWATDRVLQPFAPSADATDREWGRRLLRSGSSPAGARSLMELYLEIDIRHVLPAVQVPTLVIHRTGDLISPVAQGRYMAERIPGARLVELPGDAHIPFFGTQDDVLDEIEEHVTGTRGQRAPDRVLATVLFTDICSSTERAAAMGDARWRNVLTEHDRLVRTLVERHRGRLVKSTGDGALATFDGPARAIEGAAAIRDAIADLGLQIRAGLHTGECELIGEDVGGIAVHIGARVAATAGPGEIRVSRTVVDLVAGSGLRFEDRGEHELKGVPGAWRLLAVAP
jgi:pimeloyl-ACP methyl ester carboxylesterase/class 3 adenylate cyclase